MAKTQYSFSDDPTKLGAPSGFTLQVRDILPSAGAGFVVALAGISIPFRGPSRRPPPEKSGVTPTARTKDPSEALPGNGQRGGGGPPEGGPPLQPRRGR